MREVTFKRYAETRANKVFLVVYCMSGDSDGYEDHEVLLDAEFIDGERYPFTITDEIQTLIDNYKIIKKILDEDVSPDLDDVKENHGNTIVEMLCNLPTQEDGDCFCCIEELFLKGYDSESNIYRVKV